jgi:hypothetical protein
MSVLDILIPTVLSFLLVKRSWNPFMEDQQLFTHYRMHREQMEKQPCRSGEMTLECNPKVRNEL